jgi:hypothetical protein
VHVVNNGVDVAEFIASVKTAIKAANLSLSEPDGTIRVASIDLTINAVATRTSGGRLQFQIPLVGVQAGGSRTATRRDTHTIQVSLVPADTDDELEVRDSDVEDSLVEAVDTIRQILAAAAGGDDPFNLATGSVELSLTVTEDGAISLGWSGERNDEISHHLRIGLASSK